MTTWTRVSRQTSSFSFPSDEENNYVESGYVENGYLAGEQIWSPIGSTSNTWRPSDTVAADGFVEAGFWAEGFVESGRQWTAVSRRTTTWTPA